MGGYTSDAGDALIGLGASAIGRVPQGYVQNAPDIGGYARPIGAGRLATVRGIVLSADDRLRGRVIERLMCDLAVDLDLATDEAGVPHDYFSGELLNLIPFGREGLLAIERHRVRVTDKGRPFLRAIAATFDTYLSANRARHSAPV